MLPSDSGIGLAGLEAAVAFTAKQASAMFAVCDTLLERALRRCTFLAALLLELGLTTHVPDASQSPGRNEGGAILVRSLRELRSSGELSQRAMA